MLNQSKWERSLQTVKNSEDAPCRHKQTYTCPHNLFYRIKRHESTQGFKTWTKHILTLQKLPVLELIVAMAHFRNGCWQCWKECWGSKTPRLHGVSPASVDWNPYGSIGFTRQCGCTILRLNPTATQLKRSYMLTCSWVHIPIIAGQPIILSAMVGLTQLSSSNRGCKTVNPLISAVLS